MKKKIFSLALVLLLFVFCALPAFAAEYERLVDFAGVLSAEDYDYLLEQLDDISEEQECDVVAVITESLEGKTSTEYADDFFDYNGYGYGKERGGVLFLISLEDRDWAVSTHGFGYDALTGDALDLMVDGFYPYLEGDDYAGAIASYAGSCDSLLSAARKGETYKASFDVLFALGVSLAVGFLIALIVVSVMKGKLKTVRFQAAATEYVRPGSMNVTLNRDIFLYRIVTRREKENKSSGSGGHYSSSGSFHGGRSGKF